MTYRLPTALLWPAVLALTGALLFPSAGRDDVHIAYWSAFSLQQFGELLNYSGDPLEQGSSLLHVMVMAALATALDVELTDLGTPLSLMFGVLAVIEAGRLGRQLDARAGTAALALTATATPLVYWSFGALEATLVAFIATAFVRTSVIRLSSPGAERDGASLAPFAWGGLYVMARPEAVFVISAFFVAGAVVVGAERQALRRLLSLWGSLLLAFAMLSLWRLHTFDALFPQPVSAKVDAHILSKLWAGARYFYISLRDSPLLVALCLLPAGVLVSTWFRDRFLARGPWLVAAFIGALFAFVLASGGDWMEGARFLVTAIPSLAALAAWALSHVRFGLKAPVVGLLALAGLIQTAAFAATKSTAVPLPWYGRYAKWSQDAGVDLQRFSFFEIANRVHLRDAIFIPHLEAAVDDLLVRQPSVSIMSAQGGMVPYHVFRSRFGRLRFIDLGGLTSTDLADCRVLERNPLKRGSGGISLSDEFYLRNMAAFRSECGVEFPDIYYNVDYRRDKLAASLEASGRYRVIYVQSSDICVSGTLCPASLNGNMVLAVRRD